MRPPCNASLMASLRRWKQPLGTGSVLATEQAQQRQTGRDVKQDTRQDSRHEKVDCRQENNKSNAACRHDKRDTKQDGRQQARDIKH